MATGLQVWSATASSNATADANVNWAEGQSPSSVNDSARALMAGAAKWRADLNGSITTGGSSTAYTATSNQSMGALTAGFEITIVPHTTSGASPTLAVDSLTAKPIRSAAGTEIGAGVLIQGTPYRVTYYTSNSGEWVLHGFYGDPYGIPLGGLLPYVGSTAPNSNFVLPYGQAISRSTYSTLFSLVSTTFGTGDGSTTFNVPDIRGRAIFAKDDMGGSAAGNLTTAGSSVDGTTLGATGGAQSKAILQANLPNVNFTVSGITLNPFAVASEPADSIAGSSSVQTRGTNAGAYTLGTPTIATQGTAASGGSGTALVVMPPAMVLPYILRIL